MKGFVLHFKNKSKVFRLPVFRPEKLSLNDLFTRYGYRTVFVILFMIGLAVGSACCRGADSGLFDRMDFLFVTNIEARLRMTAFDIFVSCFASYILFMFGVFLSGLSAWGYCTIPLLAVLKGFSVGISSCAVFSLYKVSGIGFYILIILPGTVLFLFSLALYSECAFSLSLRYLRLSVFGYEREPHLREKLKIFLKKSFFAFLSSGACAVFDMLLWIFFSGRFHFE